MARKPTRKYTSEFKEQALRLSVELGSRRLAAERLGISEVNLSNWNKKKRNGERLKCSVSNSLDEGKPTAEEENRRLRKENEELKKANYILKRAAAFFSQDHLK